MVKTSDVVGLVRLRAGVGQILCWSRMGETFCGGGQDQSNSLWSYCITIKQSLGFCWRKTSQMTFHHPCQEPDIHWITVTRKKLRILQTCHWSCWRNFFCSESCPWPACSVGSQFAGLQLPHWQKPPRPDMSSPHRRSVPAGTPGTAWCWSQSAPLHPESPAHGHSILGQ